MTILPAFDWSPYCFWTFSIYCSFACICFCSSSISIQIHPITALPYDCRSSAISYSIYLDNTSYHNLYDEIMNQSHKTATHGRTYLDPNTFLLIDLWKKLLHTFSIQFPLENFLLTYSTFSLLRASNLIIFEQYLHLLYLLSIKYSSYVFNLKIVKSPILLHSLYQAYHKMPSLTIFDTVSSNLAQFFKFQHPKIAHFS